MTPWFRHTAICLAIASVSACSSSNPTTSTAESGLTDVPANQAGNEPTINTPVTGDDAPPSETPANDSPSVPTPAPPANDSPSAPTPAPPANDAPAAPTDFGDLPPPTIPPVDLLAAPIPGPSSSDPFNSLLETDLEVAVAGGAPTQPKNLRVDLVSNDWAEFSWAPSNDDGDVVAYRIYRSDGHIYTVGRDQTDPASGSQAEIEKFWNTTSFIDCNYTRFATRLHRCDTNGPQPGDIFSYEVTAVDELGNESVPSEAITINYHAERGAAVPLYSDFYLDESRFAQRHD